jgi:hypothetical protein
MKKQIPIGALVVILFAAGAVEAYAQSDAQIVPGLASNCVATFWDSQQYGWFAFRNNCGRPIHLEFVAFNGTGPFGHGGSADIPAGGSSNNGQSPREVSEQGGGYSIYVCPEGYVAIDDNGHSIDAPNRSYRCKRW